MSTRNSRLVEKQRGEGKTRKARRRARKRRNGGRARATVDERGMIGAAYDGMSWRQHPQIYSSGQHVIMEHSELVFNVIAHPSGVTPLDTLLVAPTMPEAGWLTRFSSMYEFAQLIKLHFEYVPLTSTQTSGGVALSYDYDATDPSASSFLLALQRQNSIGGPAYSRFTLETNTEANEDLPPRYTDQNANDDIRLSTFGRLDIWQSSEISLPAGASLGYIRMHYKIRYDIENLVDGPQPGPVPVQNSRVCISLNRPQNLTGYTSFCRLPQANLNAPLVQNQANSFHVWSPVDILGETLGDDIGFRLVEKFHNQSTAWDTLVTTLQNQTQQFGILSTLVYQVTEAGHYLFDLVYEGLAANQGAFNGGPRLVVTDEYGNILSKINAMDAIEDPGTPSNGDFVTYDALFGAILDVGNNFYFEGGNTGGTYLEGFADVLVRLNALGGDAAIVNFSPPLAGPVKRVASRSRTSADDCGSADHILSIENCCCSK